MKNLSSDQKQKLFILMGFAGCLIILGFVALRPSGDDNASPTVGNVATAQSVGTGSGINTPPTNKPAATPKRLAAAPAPQPTATLVRPVSAPPVPVPNRVPLAPTRPDPFAPVFLPTPPPEKSPTPIPPAVVIPPPPPVNLPSRAPAGAPPSTVLVGLPSPRISRYNPLPGPRWVVPVVSRGSGSVDTSAPAANKRLSGVIIGDSVRALLEIQQGNANGGGEGGGGAGAAEQFITRVVQPGDEVDGIKILRINREFDNGRPVTRMYVLEGDQERYIDLRPAPTPPTNNAGGEGFEGGSPSSSGSGRGGFGGSPSGGFGSGSSGGFGRGGGRPAFP